MGSAAVAVTTEGKYYVVKPTYVDGQATETQSDINGNTLVAIQALGALAGQALMAASLPVVLASNQSNLHTNLYDGAGVAVPMGQALMAASLPVVLSSNQTNIKTNLYDGAGVAVPMGQAAMSASLPVTLASDQSNLKTNLYDGAGVAVPRGQAAMAASLPVVISSDQSNLKTNLYDGAGSAVNKGQVAMAASLPVTIASDQSAIKTNLQDGSGSAVNKGQGTMAASLPVVLASDQAAIPVTATIGKLSVIDLIDVAVGPVLDTSTTNIQDNAGTFVVVAASTAAATKQIRIADTTGIPIGVYVGGAGSEVLQFIVNPGMDDIIEHSIAASSRVTVRSMLGADITSGFLIMQFMG
jgi:hypothetical protein